MAVCLRSVWIRSVLWDCGDSCANVCRTIDKSWRMTNRVMSGEASPLGSTLCEPCPSPDARSLHPAHSLPMTTLLFCSEWSWNIYIGYDMAGLCDTFVRLASSSHLYCASMSWEYQLPPQNNTPWIYTYIIYIYTSELPVKVFTESGKFTNVHAKNIHWCMQGPYIGLYMPIRVKTSVSSQSLLRKQWYIYI